MSKIVPDSERVSALGGYADGGEAVIVQASMSQVEMTVWLCVMAVLACGMLAVLAMVR